MRDRSSNIVSRCCSPCRLSACTLAAKLQPCSAHSVVVYIFERRTVFLVFVLYENGRIPSSRTDLIEQQWKASPNHGLRVLELVLALLPLFEEQSVLFSLFRRLDSEVGAALTTEDTRSKAFPLPCQKLRREGQTGRRKKWTRKTRGRRMGRKRKEQSPCPVKELPEAASHFDLLPDFSPFRGLYLFSH